MTYDNAFSIDELVQDKRKFVNKIVPVNGTLVKYAMGPGAFTWPMELELEGDKKRITVSCQIGRFAGDHLKIKHHLHAYMGEQIGIKLFADDYTITALQFGEDGFKIRQ